MTINNLAILAPNFPSSQGVNQGFTFEAKAKTDAPGEYIVQSVTSPENVIQTRPGISNPQNSDPVSQIFNQVASSTFKSTHVDIYV